MDRWWRARGAGGVGVYICPGWLYESLPAGGKVRVGEKCTGGEGGGGRGAKDKGTRNVISGATIGIQFV